MRGICSTVQCAEIVLLSRFVSMSPAAPLTAAEQARILSAIEPEFVTLTYTDPVTNSTKSGQFYSNNFPSTFAMVRNGEDWWSGLTFPLIQR